jgi:Immunoglobulin domain
VINNFFLKLNKILIKFAALSNYIKTPVIESSSKFFASEGSEFQLTCFSEVNAHMLYHVAFSHNGKIVETNDYVTISGLQKDLHDDQKASINLTITQAVKERDEGDYKCTVMDNYDNTNSATATVNFVSEPVVTMTPTKSEIEIEKGKKQATFLIEYLAYPPASFKIYNPKNESISSDMDVMDRYKYDVQIKEDQIKFKIKVPDINDFGDYIIVATTAGQNFSTKLKLIVSGELIIV